MCLQRLRKPDNLTKARTLDAKTMGMGNDRREPSDDAVFCNLVINLQSFNIGQLYRIPKHCFDQWSKRLPSCRP